MALYGNPCGKQGCSPVVTAQQVVVQTPAVTVTATPQATVTSLAPSIVKFSADQSVIAPNITIDISWEATNAVVCAVTEDKNSIQVPFVGHLPSGDMSVTITSTQYNTIDAYRLFLVCADKDWNTVNQELVIPKDHSPIVFTVAPTIDYALDASGYYYAARVTYQTNKPTTLTTSISLSGLAPWTTYNVDLTFKDLAGDTVQRTLTFTTGDASFPYNIPQQQDAWYDHRGVASTDRCYTTSQTICSTTQWQKALGN